MKNIGGEIELNSSSDYEYFTDSGRSSLRLILKNLNKKKFLVPNFLCKIILEIFNENNINYDFYQIDENLNLSKKTILNSKYDVLYIINYFGKYQKIDKQILNKKIIIEDNVFLPFFYNIRKVKKCIIRYLMMHQIRLKMKRYT